MCNEHKPYLSKNEPTGATKIFEKQCQFPECTNIYRGVGASKYCEEHQKQQYKKELLKMKDVELKKEHQENAKSNVIIDHSYTKATMIKSECPCGRKFDVQLIPGVYIYPKYCMEHRNIYRRNQLDERLANDK